MTNNSGTDEHLFSNGEAIAHIETLVDDEPRKAATLCRAVLTERELDDKSRERVESMLEETMNNPVAWKEAVLQWADNPSLQRWRELMQFVRPDDLYDRLRDARAYLRGRGIEADLLFRCLTDEVGTTPDVLQLVSSGEVSPNTVAERAEKAPATAEGVWYAMAGRAALARGDELGVVRWLKRAYNSRTDRQLVEINCYELWGEADDQLRDILEKKGLAPSSRMP